MGANPLSDDDEAIISERRASSDELNRAILELIEAFGRPALVQALEDLDIACNAKGKATDPFQVLRAYSTLIIDASNPRLIATLVARLCGLDTAAGNKRKPLSALAREFNITKQRISKKQDEIAQALGIPNNYMSEEARQSYRISNRRNYGLSALPHHGMLTP